MHRCLSRAHGQVSSLATPAWILQRHNKPLRRRPRLSLTTSTTRATQPWPTPGFCDCLHRQRGHNRPCIIVASTSTSSSSSGNSSSGSTGDAGSKDKPLQEEQQQQYEVHPALTQQQQERQQSMLEDAAGEAVAAKSPSPLQPRSPSPTPLAAPTAEAAAAAAATPASPSPSPPPAAAAGNDTTHHRHKRHLPRPPSPQQVLQMFPPAARPPPVLAAFIGGGALMSGMLLNWAAGTPLRRANPYSMHITFEHASKIGPGTPVRMKGVQIGAVASVSVNPSHIDVVAEVQDAHNVVPLASRVDINQFGLAADPFVDITPPEGCRVNPRVGPHHPKCREEGFIVCDGQQIAGSQGGSMDYMMKQFIKYQDKSRHKAIQDEYRDG